MKWANNLELKNSFVFLVYYHLSVKPKIFNYSKKGTATQNQLGGSNVYFCSLNITKLVKNSKETKKVKEVLNFFILEYKKSDVKNEEHT